MATSGLRYRGEAIPYAYIGDSHAGSIGTLLFDDERGGKPIVTQLFRIWRFVASDALGPDGMVGDELMQVLRRAGAFHSQPGFAQLPGLRPVLTTYGTEKRTEFQAVTETANERAYVLCVGEIDLRYILHRFTVEEIDFHVPFPTGGLERLAAYPARQTLRADKMLTFLGESFQPLFVALRILRAAGLRSLFLHCLPPPTLDEEDALRVYQHRSPALLRYKLAMYVNYLYEAVCKDVGVGFVNTWPAVTEGNLLKPQFYLDGLHLNREHAVLSVSEVRRQMPELSVPAA